MRRSQLTLHTTCSTPINSFSLAPTQQSWKNDIAPPLSTCNQQHRCHASADANQTQMATTAEQHYLHPKGATPMPTQVTQMPPTVTYSKKWSITASGHTNVSALRNNNIISDTISVTSESACCLCRSNPHPRPSWRRGGALTGQGNVACGELRHLHECERVPMGQGLLPCADSTKRAQFCSCLCQQHAPKTSVTTNDGTHSIVRIVLLYGPGQDLAQL